MHRVGDPQSDGVTRWDVIRAAAGSPLPCRIWFAITLTGFVTVGVFPWDVAEVIGGIAAIFGMIMVMYHVSAGVRRSAAALPSAVASVIPTQRLMLWLLGLPDASETTTRKLFSVVLALLFVAAIATMGS